MDDATRYNYGPGGWQPVITQIPQLVDTHNSPETVKQRKAEAMEEAQYTHKVEHYHDEETEDETDSDLLELYAGATGTV